MPFYELEYLEKPCYDVMYTRTYICIPDGLTSKQHAKMTSVIAFLATNLYIVNNAYMYTQVNSSSR
jgi:hypothetical protein